MEEIGVQGVVVERKGNFLIYEGDIILDKLTFGAGSTKSIHHDYLWPKSQMSYDLPDDHPYYDRIVDAIEAVNQGTVLCLQPMRSSDKDFVRFEYLNDGCNASWLGRQGGLQEIFIGDAFKGSIMHEIFHAAGLYHEHNRQDRGDSLLIHKANIDTSYLHAFDVYPVSLPEFQVGYDPYSLMHTHARAYSVNENNSFDVINLGEDKNPGQREGLSGSDYQKLIRIYHRVDCP
jgi:hypothetical protein